MRTASTQAGAGRVASLPIHDVFSGQSQMEGMNLSFTYDGSYGDILPATGKQGRDGDPGRVGGLPIDTINGA